MSEKKILKFYNVNDYDVDDYGNVNPEAKLLPLFNGMYNIDPKEVKETLSSEDWYDDKTNVHDDRHFYVNLPDGSAFKDLPVKHRGYSALSYFSKPDRTDSLMSNWRKILRQPGDLNSASVFSPKNKFSLYADALGRIAPDNVYDIYYGVPPDERDAYVAKYLKDADKRSLKSFIDHILRDTAPKHRRNHQFIIPVVASTDDSDIIKLHDLWKGYDPGRDNLNEVQTRHIYDKYVPKNWIKYYSLEDLHNSIDSWRDSIRNRKIKPDAFGHTGLGHFNSILSLINEVTPDGSHLLDINDIFKVYPDLADSYNMAADVLHYMLNDIDRKYPTTKNTRFTIYAPYTIDKLLREDFPYENKHGKTPTLSDKHYKQIIYDLYDDIQSDKTRSNITNTLMEAKYV